MREIIAVYNQMANSIEVDIWFTYSLDSFFSWFFGFGLW